MFNRENAIADLVNDDMVSIVECGAVEFLRGILTSGFVGYENMTDEELMVELEERDISYNYGDDDYDDSMDGDLESGLASAGWGTDESYGYYGDDLEY